ncbi:hypothetical protein ABIF90_000173 [Bradyrhizobium japonicum]
MWNFVYDDADKLGSMVLGSVIFMAGMGALWKARLSSRAFWRGLALACFISSGSILTFAHEFLGVSSIFTAAFLMGTTVALFLLGNWRPLAVQAADIAFGIFLAGTAISIALNGFSDAKEFVLFALALAAYPAGRVFAGGSVEPTFTFVSAAIIAIGAITILAAINAGPGYVDSIGKVFVFGNYGAAPLHFAATLAFAIAALVARPLTMAQAVRVALVVVPPTAIIAAAMVRFSFVAILAMLAVAAFPLTTKDRRALAVFAGALVFAVAVGQIIRPSTAALFLKFGMESLGVSNKEQVAQPGCVGVDERNTIEIRKQLYREAFQLLPQSALVGIGLDRFKERPSCLSEKNEVHNSALQVAIEFGWPAGIAFSVLMLLAGRTALLRAPASQEARFALCALTFMFCMSMGHGTVSRDAHLFLFLGYAVSAGQPGQGRQAESAPS